MNNKKRLLSAFTACAMLLSVFTGCGDEGNESSGSIAAESAVSSQTSASEAASESTADVQSGDETPSADEDTSDIAAGGISAADEGETSQYVDSVKYTPLGSSDRALFSGAKKKRRKKKSVTETSTSELKKWSDKEADSKKKLTIMVYMVGSDLESRQELMAATNDIVEMADSGLDDKDVNLVVYCGGARTWWVKNFPKDKNAYLEYTSSSPELRGSGSAGFNMYEADKKNMGEADTFAQFLKDVPEKYPASDYALICWDHGGGPVFGYGSDENNKNAKTGMGDSLLISEMKTALDKSKFSMKKLKFVGFDACLMASIELADLWKDYADYMVASADVEPGCGWDYSFLSAANMSLDTKQLTTKIVDTYFTTVSELSATYSIGSATLTAFDLSKTDRVISAFSDLFKAMDNDLKKGSRTSYKALCRNVHSYATYDLADLGTISSALSSSYSSQSTAARKAMNDLVSYGRTTISGTAGMTIYFPKSNNESDYDMSAAIYAYGGSDYISSNPISPEYSDLMKTLFAPESKPTVRASDFGSLEAEVVMEGETSSNKDFTRDGCAYLQLTEEQLGSISHVNYTIYQSVMESANKKNWSPLIRSIPADIDENGVVQMNLDLDFVGVSSEESEAPMFCESAWSGEDEYTLYGYFNARIDGDISEEICLVAITAHINGDGSAEVTNIRTNQKDGQGLTVINKDQIDLDDWMTFCTFIYGRPVDESDPRKPLMQIDQDVYGWNFIDVGSTFDVVPIALADTNEKYAVQVSVFTVDGQEFCTPVCEFSYNNSVDSVTEKIDSGELVFNIYDDHAELAKFKASSKHGDVTIPEKVGGKTVTAIRKDSFTGSSPKSITMPDTVVTMERLSSGSLGSLESIKLSKNLKEIPARAFCYCGIESIELPEGLERIGVLAFSHAQLKSINIPKSVYSIGAGAFSSCQYLDTITVESGSKDYSAEGNVLYSADKKTLEAFTGRSKSEFAVPEGVEIIGDFAFNGSFDDNVFLNSIPDAKKDPVGLTKITFPSTLVSIGNYAFEDCMGFKEIVLPDSLEYIGAGAFGSSMLNSIMYDTAGTDFMVLDSLKLGANVSRIRAEAFSAYTVKKIEISSDNPFFKTDGRKITSIDGSQEISIFRNKDE